MKFNLNLIAAFRMIVVILGLVGLYTVLSTIWLLIYGVVADVATDGSIAVQENVSAAINGTVATNISFFTGLNSSVTVIIGLVILVVVLIIFWPMIKAGMEGSNKGDGDVM